MAGYFENSECKLAQYSAIHALVFSLISLSNSTKNQRDSFSSFILSYYTKLLQALFFSYLTMKQADFMSMFVVSVFALFSCIDAAFGATILYAVFSS